MNFKEELKALGLWPSGTQLAKAIASSNDVPIVIPYSLIDYSRNSLDKLTHLKLQNYLLGLQLIHQRLKKPLPRIHILVTDTLQRHNFPLNTDAEFQTIRAGKVNQLATVLNIPQISARILDGI